MSPRIKIKKGRALDGWVPGDTPVVTITGFDAAPDIKVPNSSFTATAVDTEQGDMAASIQWELVSAFEIAATAGVAQAAVGGAPAGSVVPLTTASATYDVDVTFEDGGLQQLAVVVANTDDYDAIAAILDGAVSDGTITFAGGAFVFTDDAASGTSTALVAAGTAGSGGGDLFAAITAEAAGNPAVTFPTPVAGTDLVPEELVIGGTGANPTLDFIVAGAQDVRAFVVDGPVVGDDTQAVTATDL